MHSAKKVGETSLQCPEARTGLGGEKKNPSAKREKRPMKRRAKKNLGGTTLSSSRLGQGPGRKGFVYL